MIDLRDAAAEVPGHGAATIRPIVAGETDSLFPDVSASGAELLAALQRLGRSGEELAGYFFKALNDASAIDALRTADDAPARHWGELLALLGPVERPSRYVGTFRAAMTAASRYASSMPSEDRRLVSQLLLHVTAKVATNHAEFRQGVAAAAGAHPSAVEPAGVVDGLVRICLTYRHPPPRLTAATFGLPLALEIAGSGTGPYFMGERVWPLRAAVAQVPVEAHAALLTRCGKLHKHDRRLMRSLIPPPTRS